jgi:hypothetical protein
MALGMTPLEQWEALLAYLRMKVEQRDWHGVADAACDMRELEAKHTQLREVRNG